MCVVVVVRLVMLPGEVEVAAVIAVQAVVVVGSSPGSGPALSLSFHPLGTAHCAASYAVHGPSHADTRVLSGRGRAGGRGRVPGAARDAARRIQPAADHPPLLPRRSQLLAGPGGASAAARHFFSCGGDLARPGLRRRQLSPLLFLAGPWSSTVPTAAAPASPGPVFGMLLRRDLVELELLPGAAAFCRSAVGLAAPRPLSPS